MFFSSFLRARNKFIKTSVICVMCHTFVAIIASCYMSNLD